MSNFATSLNLIGPDTKGFYSVGDQKFYRKFEAVEFHNKTGFPIRWNFNDDIYNLFDWEIEPTESLEELYRQHAQKLRDRYDHLVLWYSGGADSDNILNTFISNNIRLDEVASYVNYDATGDKYNFLNGEIYNVAIPKVQECQQQQPWLKHTMLDLSKLTVDYFNTVGADWVYNVNGIINPNTSARQQIKKYNLEWQQLLNSGKKIGFIHGIDKPRVTGINGKYYFRFVDLFDSLATGAVQEDNHPGNFDEFFYWTVDTPKIPIKQAHVIKNFLKTSTVDSPWLTPADVKDPVSICSITLNGKFYWLKRDAIHTLIYPQWKSVPYQNKAMCMFFTPRDEWFFKLPESDTVKKYWKQGLDYLWQSTPDHLKASPGNIMNGFKILGSKIYNLGS